MIRSAVAVLVTAVLLMPSPAHADESKVSSTSIIRLIPGARDTIFNDGDPVKLCFGVKTEQVFDGQVTMAIEMKSTREGATWHTVMTVSGSANTVGCSFGTISGSNDFALRSRTLNRPGIAASTSRVIQVVVN